MSLPFEVWASPEPTVARIDAETYRDELAETGHAERIDDLALLAGLGIAAARYPVLWERTATDASGVPDLRWARVRLERLRALGVEPIVTLLHHGSGPRSTSLIDPDFPAKFARYAGAVARTFPWVRRWTPINEPLTTARFATLYGHWYPNLRSDAAFGTAMTNQALAMLLGMEAIRMHVADAHFVITEDLQSFTSEAPSLQRYVAHKRERMYLSLELVAGRVVPGHPMYAYLHDVCGVPEAMLARIIAHACVPGLVGWNYYPHSERVLSIGNAREFRNESAKETQPISPLPLLRIAHARLGMPFGLSEVHMDGDEAARVAWLRARTADLCELHAQGLPVRMIGAWAAFGMIDWRSLLLRREGQREDGVFTFAGPGERPQETAVARELRAMSASVAPLPV